MTRRQTERPRPTPRIEAVEYEGRLYWRRERPWKGWRARVDWAARGDEAAPPADAVWHLQRWRVYEQ